MGRFPAGVPLVDFHHAPGTVPIDVAHLPAAAGPPVGGAHAHDFLVLHYAHRAAGTMLVDGRPWAVSDGDLFLIAPGQVVSFADPHAGIVAEGWAVWFPIDAVRSEVYASWRAHPLLFPFARGIDRAQRLRVPPAERAAWLAACAGLDAELTGRRDGYQEAALAHLTLLLVAVTRLSADVADQLRSSEEPLLAAVFEVIEERYPTPLSAAEVAAAVALTPGHLTTVVRRRTGRTVQQWITSRRMRAARLLLTGTDQTVAAIGRRVGYPDAGYFIRRFRTEHGMTPAVFRSAGSRASSCPD